MSDNETNAVILDTVLKIKEDVGHIKASVANIDAIVKDHNTRIEKVEDGQKKVKWMAVGAGAAFGVVWRVVEAFLGGPHH